MVILQALSKFQENTVEDGSIVLLATKLQVYSIISIRKLIFITETLRQLSLLHR